MQQYDLNSIILDPEPVETVYHLMKVNYRKNPGCMLHPHWEEGFRKDYERIKYTKKLEALNWLGGGYPAKTSLCDTHNDWAKLSIRFKNTDTLDIQSGLYQFYQIFEQSKKASIDLNNLAKVDIVEIGGGYGRLAMFFLAYFGKRCHYVSVEFSPHSLVFASQVIHQFFPELKIADILTLQREPNLKEYNYISLPAWEINRLQSGAYHLGLNIHSFQEMKKESFTFYISELNRLLSSQSLCYTINQPPDNSTQTQIKYENHAWYGSETYFEEIFSQVYPLGPDWVKICGIPMLERGFVKKSVYPKSQGCVQKLSQLSAALIFSRFHWENEHHRNIGSGRMQQEAFACLQNMGFKTYFAGQEDVTYPPEVMEADVIVSLAPGLLKLPPSTQNRALKFLYTCNTHVTEKIRRLQASSVRWNLPIEELPNEEVFKQAYALADYYLIAENDAGIQNFVRNGCDPQKIRRYNNCVDTDVWLPYNKKRQSLTFVCWAAAHGLKKGLPALLQAWKMWYKGQNTELHLIGLPTNVSDILLKGQRYGKIMPGLYINLQSFRGQDPLVIQFLGSCHVGILPTLEDAQPSSLLEMASCGLPIITTQESGAEFTLDFCYYCQADNPQGLCEAFEYWYEKRNQLEEAGKRARHFIEKYHIWQIFHEKFTQIILGSLSTELLNRLNLQNPSLPSKVLSGGNKNTWTNGNITFVSSKQSDQASSRYPLLQNITIYPDNASFDSIGYDVDNPQINGEYSLLPIIAKSAQVIFDVGANKGFWSKCIASLNPTAQLFAFEPVPDTFEILKQTLKDVNASLYNIAISNENGEKTFFYYKDSSELAELSTFYRRNASIEGRLNLHAVPIQVQTMTLESFCAIHSITRIDLLKVDTEGSELDVLQGASALLKNKQIIIIQFEYGGCYLDAKITLRQVYELLTKNGYSIFRIIPDGLVHITIWRDSLENYRYANYLAVAPCASGKWTALKTESVSIDELTNNTKNKDLPVFHYETDENEKVQLLEVLQKDFRNVPTLIRLAEIELQQSNNKKARNYLIGALALEPQNEAAKALWKKLQR